MWKKSVFWLPLRSSWYRALLALLVMLIPMALLSQTSEPKLNNSDVTLQTWEQTSAKFRSELTALRQDLQTALNDAKQSTTSLQKLTVLYENSLTRIANLEAFNDQIGQRMQESDEWNAELQDDNVKLKAEVKVAKSQGLRNTIISGISGIILGVLLPFIIKLLKVSKIVL
jgi:multidrug resistance efflux pump